jgi:hypothetical protein
MPINDPIRGRKVAPASLAFENGRRARGGSAATYQSSIRTESNVTVVQNPTDLRETIARDQAAQRNVMDAERRAKHWVGDYQASTEWDIKLNLNITHSPATYDPIGFDNEVIRCVGSRFEGTASAANARWYFEPTKGNQGVWWFYAGLHLVVPLAAQIENAYLAFFKNQTIWRVIDYMCPEQSGHDNNHMVDTRLGGGCHVPLAVGDEFDVRVLLQTGGPVVDTIYVAPSSAYGWVSGHRTQCEWLDGNQPTAGTITPS